MNALGLIESIAPILYRHKDRASITSANGSEFICKIDGAPMRYLHRLYQGSEAVVRDVANLWGEQLPVSYREFLTRFNGATLFDNSLHIFGLPKEFNRGLSLEDQRAFSIEDVIMRRRPVAPPAFDSLPVASITATEVFRADLRHDGRVTLKGDGGDVREFASFADFIRSLCLILDNLSDENGLHDDSCEELQREMIEFISSAAS